MSGPCSAHQGPCPYDCHINGERKRLLDDLRREFTHVEECNARALKAEARVAELESQLKAAMMAMELRKEAYARVRAAEARVEELESRLKELGRMSAELAHATKTALEQVGPLPSVSPNCCTTSTEQRSITIFVPMGDGGYSKTHWAVPIRNDEGEVVKNGVTTANFCPFCGAKLGREHLPFEGDPIGPREAKARNG